jgi:hypothetical protein
VADGGGWDFDQVAASEVAVDLTLLDMTDAAARKVEGKVTGTFEVSAGGPKLTLTAERPEGAESWTLEAKTAAGEVVDLVALVTKLVPAGVELPKDLPKGNVKDVVVTYALAERKISVACASEGEFGFGELGGVSPRSLTVEITQAPPDSPDPPQFKIEVEGQLKLMGFVEIDGTLTIDNASMSFVAGAAGVLISMPGFSDFGLKFGSIVLARVGSPDLGIWMFDLGGDFAVGGVDIPMGLHVPGPGEMDLSKLGIRPPGLPDAPDMPDPGLIDANVTLRDLPIDFKPKLGEVDLVKLDMSISGWKLGKFEFPALTADLTIKAPSSPDLRGLFGTISGKHTLQGIEFEVKVDLPDVPDPSAPDAPGWVLTLGDMPAGELVDLKALLEDLLPDGAELPDQLPEVKVGEVDLRYELKTPKLSLSCKADAGVEFGGLGKLEGTAFSVVMEQVP